MTTNLWQEFEGLLPRDPLQVAKVVAHNSDGTSTVEFENASRLRVRGQSVAVNDYAFIRGGEVRGEAPAVVPVVLEV